MIFVQTNGKAVVLKMAEIASVSELAAAPGKPESTPLSTPPPSEALGAANTLSDQACGQLSSKLAMLQQAE